MAHYLFGEHRPLIGREEFLCRGYPAELPLRGLSDRQMRQLAAKSAPLPLLGAALAALLSMADFSHSSLASIPGYQHLAAQIGHLQLPQVDSAGFAQRVRNEFRPIQ
ncbi:unnamed protein product [Effrenium voratum]|uniref:Uncharacterized protein n=1 Tax=Effrenium voratum TaxID=2562239 RepID=A0AA36J1X5_9DINO|nr:unnamed protein product [Effrenium voratum]